MRRILIPSIIVIASVLLIAYAVTQAPLHKKNTLVEHSRVPSEIQITEEKGASSQQPSAPPTSPQPSLKIAVSPEEEKIALCIKRLNSDDIKESQKAAQEIIALGDAAVGQLVKALSSKSLFLKGQAVFLLGKIGNNAAVGPLTELLRNNDNAYIRRNAAQALGNMHDSQAYDALVTGTQDNDPGVRVNAVTSLGNSGELSASQVLVGMMRAEKEMSVRFALVQALGELKDPLAAAPLATELALEADRIYKNDIARALGKIGNPVALSALREYLAELKKLNMPEPMLKSQIEMAVTIVEEAIVKINQT